MVMMQSYEHASLLAQREEEAAQAQRELSVQLDRAELEAVRADRQRQTAAARCQSLQKQCDSLQRIACNPASADITSPDYKLQSHHRHRLKHSRSNQILAHM